MPIGSRGQFDFGMDSTAKKSAREQSDTARSGAGKAMSPADLAREQAKSGSRRLKRVRVKEPAVTGKHSKKQMRSEGALHPRVPQAQDSPSHEEPAPNPAPRAPRGGSIREVERQELRKKKLVVGGVLAVLVLFSLCITGTTPMIISPLEVAEIYALRIQQLWLGIFDPTHMPTAADMIAQHPTYYWTLTHLSFTVAFVLCGFMLALSGALYQNVFRNPIASPSMLGVSSGIQLAVAVLICIFGTMAGAMLVERHVISYIFVAVILVLLFGLSMLMSGRGRPLNVTNMLVVGVVLNQFVGVIVTYISFYVFDDELYDIFASMTSLVTPVNNPLSWAFLLVGFAVSVIPVFLMRFRMNALGFSPGEMKMFGVNGPLLQVIALLCGTVIMVTAQLQVGMVAMITLVVPHISRAVFGSEFRKQFVGTMLIGAAVLVACEILVYIIPYSGEIPVGTVVNLVLLPAFVWLIATQQRRWE